MDTQSRGPDRSPGAGFEEIVAEPSPSRPRTDPGGGGSGRTGGGRRGLGRWLPVLAVGGLAVAIVGAGLLGPKAPTADLGPAEPSEGPWERPAIASPAAPTIPPTPAPLLRVGGALPDDPFLLLGGRWIDLAGGTAVGETGCELERPLLLAGGRIVCVARQKGRPPGSTWATYELSVVTLGRARPAPAEPWTGPPAPAAEGVLPAATLTSLVGRRDLAFGDPVAVAVAAGPERDELLLAWAVLGEGGYRVGLDRYRVGDAGTSALGSREILAHPLEDERGLASLADLSVSLAPGGGSALVGVTITRNPPEAGTRRLAVVPLGAVEIAGGAAALPPSAVGEPVLLPAEAAAAEGAAAGEGAAGAPCGGSTGEGWVAEELVYLVCPGPAGGLRVLAAGVAGGAAAEAGDVVSTGLLEPGGTQIGPGWLAGNGVVVDPAGRVTYRWSPAAGTLWRISADREGRAAVRPLALNPRRGYLDVDPGSEPAAAGALPVLALDAARGRLFALDAPVPGTAGRAVVHVIDVERWSHFVSFPLADGATRAIALSPDGRLLYASTAPRDGGSGRPTTGVAVLDAATGVELVYAGRLPVAAVRSLQAAIVR